MSSIMDNETKNELKKILQNLKDPVNLVFFTQKNECPLCKHQHKMVEELAGMSGKIKLEIYDFVKDRDKVTKYKIDKIPALVVKGEKDYGIRFFGVTAGYEFSSLLDTLLMVSHKDSGLPPGLKNALKMIQKPVHMQVMVTVTCPYCPKAVHIAQQFAMENENIRADMVEVSGFPHVAQKYSVQGVPRTVINEVNFFEGAMPEEMTFLEVLKAVEPETMEKLEEEMKETQEQRKVKKADPEHIYETIIIGAGPAGLSASVYAARKALDVLLVSKTVGGQIYYTASVENYLGFPSIDGREMIDRFVKHAENYPIAEHLGENVKSITKEKDDFVVKMEKGTVFKGKSVVYTAGKEYRRLGVPGEDRLIGKGIAFCATCDAPLYKDKVVAVVGGGNSALTAVRDLIPYARMIYLIHRRDEFRGDSVILEELKKVEKVKIFTSWVVVEFMGTNKLSSLRMVKTDASDMQDIMVDGVFLEIGLSPNSAPVKELLKLNQYGEIPVTCENRTDLEGFFAAGDVTDVAEKQICVAVGEGAKAAITVNRYLQEKGFTKSTSALKDSWQ